LCDGVRSTLKYGIQSFVLESDGVGRYSGQANKCFMNQQQAVVVDDCDIGLKRTMSPSTACQNSRQSR
jgi:hypothetical protein